MATGRARRQRLYTAATIVQLAALPAAIVAFSLCDYIGRKPTGLGFDS